MIYLYCYTNNPNTELLIQTLLYFLFFAFFKLISIFHYCHHSTQIPLILFTSPQVHMWYHRSTWKAEASVWLDKNVTCCRKIMTVHRVHCAKCQWVTHWLAHHSTWLCRGSLTSHTLTGGSDTKWLHSYIQLAPCSAVASTICTAP